MKKISLVIFGLLFTGLVILYSQKDNLQLLQKTSSTGEVNQQTGGLVDYTETRINLEISQPKDRTTIAYPELTVIGKTTAGAEIFINDLQTTADERGNFQANIVVDEGENIIAVVVNDSQGNFAEKELTITLESVE